ncbi:LysM peptidoglycan-binding domain-containing protein [Streptosporangiaceae bacterium NEAU-GS5]|nr:LysM peptidoglycan-binding domain-containing protein [Streptosporangiaceae bacterium NEAU-GS5]
MRAVRLTRRGRIVLIAFAVALALIVLWLGTHAPVTASTRPGSTAGLSYVTVGQGDTLWSIAAAVSPADDPGPVVRQIMNLNGLSDSFIRPGVRIYLPRGL